jgi:serine protease Do
VRLERDGQRVGFGAVLRGDGRIVTALSALGHGNQVKARFADDTVLPVHVVATDRAWDLALVEAEGGHWTRGLRPSALDPSGDGTPLRRFRGRSSRLEETPFTVSSRRALVGRDGVVLENMLLQNARLGSEDLGSPLLDEGGDVVALVVQACAPTVTRTCQLEPFGAPVSAVKSFLRAAPPRRPLPAAFVGFRGAVGHEGSVAGVRLVAIEPGSPAAAAGLRAGEPSKRGGDELDAPDGDLVVAVDDVPVTTPEELSDAINRVVLASPTAGATAAPSPPSAAGTEPAPESGRRARLLVYGSGKFREVALDLKPPRDLPKP